MTDDETRKIRATTKQPTRMPRPAFRRNSPSNPPESSLHFYSTLPIRLRGRKARTRSRVPSRIKILFVICLLFTAVFIPASFQDHLVALSAFSHRGQWSHRRTWLVGRARSVGRVVFVVKFLRHLGMFLQGRQGFGGEFFEVLVG